MQTERQADDVVTVLRHLVSMPTESRTPNRPLIDWVADQLQVFGARVSIVDGPTGRANLLASIGPDLPGGLLLSGHTDVVPAGVGWATEPYDLVESGTELVGRGTADMKGFIACAIVALQALDPDALRCPVHLALSFDEEVGCVGVRSLLDEIVTGVAGAGGGGTTAAVAPDLIVIGEPTMMRPRHAHMGKVAFQLVFRALAGHSSLSPFLPTAIGAAVRVVDALDAVAAPHAKVSTRDASGEASAKVTANVGTINGGTALNVLSERCEMTFELRHTTEFDPDELLQPVWAAVEHERRVLAEVGGVDVTEITRYPALCTEVDDPMVRLVERIADRGSSVPIGYGTEGGLFAAAIDAPVMICGPGDIGVAHKPDEHVSIEQLQACSHFVERLILEVCGIADDAAPR